MQRARAILPSVGGHAIQHFSTLSHNRHDFRKKRNIIEQEMRVFIFCKNFVRYISHCKKN